MTKISNFWKAVIFLFLLLWLGFLYAQKIDLATADLGRHLQNGKWVVENRFNLFEKNSPLHQNFYSYTHSDFPVVNHHWGSGLIFYLFWRYFGFSGLSLLYILLSLSAFVFFFWIACRESNFFLAFILAFLLAPLMAERTEIRPEVFSALFSAVFFFWLWRFWRGEINWKWLFFLIPLQILWVNFHVYFFLGIFLTGIFLFSEITRIIFSKLTDEEFREGLRRIRIFATVLILISLSSLVNPFGVEGFLYPLKIFKNYSYTIVENKSVSFVENYGVVNPNFILIKATLILMIASFALLFAVDWKKAFIHYLLLAVFFGAVGWAAIRNFTLLGFFAFPILAYNFHSTFKQKEGEINIAKENGIAILYIVVVIIGFYCNYQYVKWHRERSGIGLAPGVERAAEFAKKNGISGPFFNNYDIGSYMIWNFYPQEKVFVDNRPEAYPDSFFSQIYKPMQEKADIFKKVDGDYNFNAVIFYRNDITPWGMNFLKMIQDDQNWALIYLDDYVIMYLKNNESNRPVIDKFQIK